MKKEKNYNKGKMIALIFIIILVIVIAYNIFYPIFIKNSLSTIEYGEHKVKLNDNVKNLDINFDFASITNIADSSDNDFVTFSKIDNLKVKDGYSWTLEDKNPFDYAIYFKGVNNSKKEINIKDGEIEYIRVRVDSSDELEDKIFVFNDFLLGETRRSDVSKKIKKLKNIKGVVISEHTDNIYIKINDDLYVEFIFKNYILNECIISSYYI